MLGLVTQLVLDLAELVRTAFCGTAGRDDLCQCDEHREPRGRAIRSGKRTRRWRPSRQDRIALEAALIPQINALLAVGLVSLPGMMTGQILSGVDPLIAARYQILVMCMIFGSAGLAAAIYLKLGSDLGSGLGSDPNSKPGSDLGSDPIGSDPRSDPNS